MATVFVSKIYTLLIICCQLEILAANCNSVLKADFFGAKNRMLYGFVYHRINCLSPVNCVRDCQLDTRCFSVNYIESENLCELNNASRSQFPSSFQHLQGTFYFDRDQNTTVYGVDSSDGGPAACLGHFASCKELRESCKTPSGVYEIFPGVGEMVPGGLRIYCDMETDGGGWIVIQMRSDGSVNFDRSWADYQSGFGDLAGEFWLGNDHLRALTTETEKTWELRVDLEDWSGKTAWAGYFNFQVTGTKYTLNLEEYNPQSTAGDPLMEKHNGEDFTTFDKDNDGNIFVNCNFVNPGGWWFHNCHDANLNGDYYLSPSVLYNQGLQWETWKGNSYSLKSCSMKIREKED